ncbi:MAG TPA: hypothetical protein VKI41_00565 [Vicinamibacteria bacterium]|nr:hypothetical protein [Vicinamibacteria bacterium]
MRKVAIVLSFVILPAFAGPLSAHAGHEHKALGTVLAVDASHLDLKTKDGKTVSVQLNAETRYLKAEGAATLADVKVSERVVVTYTEKDEKYLAKEVRLGVVEKAQPPPSH